MSSSNVNLDPNFSKDFYLHSFIDPISLNPMKTPYCDLKGHSFEFEEIQEFIKQTNSCPLGGEPLKIEDLQPNQSLKQRIDFLQQQSKNECPHVANLEEIPCPKNEKENLEYAAGLLMKGKEYEEKGEYGLAEEFYLDAIKRSSKSEHYGPLPHLFELKKEPTRAAAAYNILSDLQAKEGKDLETIESLEKSLSLFPSITIKEKLANTLKFHNYCEKASDHYLELALQSLYNKDDYNGYRYAEEVKNLSPERAEAWKILARQPKEIEKQNIILINGAKIEKMPLKDRKTLCKIALIRNRSNMSIQLLLNELKTLGLKNKVTHLKTENANLETLLKKATEPKKKTSNSPPSSKTESAQNSISPPKVPEFAFGKQQWEEYFGDVGKEPPLPANINEILKSPCPFFKHMKIKASHDLFLMPKTINNEQFSFQKLVSLIFNPKKGSKIDLYTSKSFHPDSLKKPNSSYWVLITKTIIPNSDHKGCQSPEEYQGNSNRVHTQNLGVNLNYDIPTVLEAAASQLIPFARSQTYSYHVQTMSQEKDRNGQSIPIGRGHGKRFTIGELAQNPGMAAVLRLPQ